MGMSPLPVPDIQTTIVLREKGKPDNRMAECIPDRLSAKASRGEERTFALLKKLPDDYLIWYEPDIDNRHPDFIVIAPDLGVIIIEVKSWLLDIIVGGNHSEIPINTDNRVRDLLPA
ncbi:MAG: NERD domain-containing protein [Methanoregulaceae archaeon]|nr:MAG: NERD domain-containing protein [Methanoregulaceae archaeon]